MEAPSDSLLKLYEVYLGGGGEEEVVATGFKIVATIVAKSRATLNTITRQIPKFFEIYTIYMQRSVNGL